MSVHDYVSREFEILAQVVYEYDQNLRLEMIPFEHHHMLIDKSKVFRVIDIRNGSVVLTADSLSNPRDILERLFLADGTKHDPVAVMDARNAAIEALNNQRFIEEREAAKDFVSFVVRNQKSRWKHNGVMRDDEFRNLGPAQTHIT
jgi:hypothetical protein